MSYEYYIRSSSTAPELWNSINEYSAKTLLLVETTSDCLTFKDTGGENDWAFDVRIFNSDPVLLEISSWGDATRLEIVKLLQKVNEEERIQITDDDGEVIDLLTE